MNRHLIGLLLGTEEDWPAAFEAIMRRMGTVRAGAGEEHGFDIERITIEPFDLRATPLRPGHRPAGGLVLRPAGWLKKVALMDDVYLMNSPFTFQSMEKRQSVVLPLQSSIHSGDVYPSCISVGTSGFINDAPPSA